MRVLREHLCADCERREVVDEGWNTTPSSMQWADVVLASGMRKHVCPECARAFLEGRDRVTKMRQENLRRLTAVRDHLDTGQGD